MKKLILGIGIFICGLITFCMDYAVNRIIDAMPGVSIVDGVAVLPLSIISCVIMLIGIILVVLGYMDK